MSAHPTPTPFSMLSADRPFALIARDATTVEILVGDVVDVELLADIPLTDATGAPREVLALVPFRQVVERGFDCHDDRAPLRCLIVDSHVAVPLDEAISSLPTGSIPLRDVGFEISDDEYATTVRRVIADEIGRGEGANFVIRRDFTATVTADPLTAALTWFRALLEHERGAYWTFVVSTPGHLMIGASPEAHVTSTDGLVTMNPISGTFRHPAEGVTKEGLAEFLVSAKETEELFMVVDEELKMMSAVCSDGGRITGPRLKEMSRLTHTEYVLQGRSTMDPREILRETMFAPTVTGSPMQNACTVIARHEPTPRGYYSGVAALFTPSLDPTRETHNLDAPILIRTAYLADATVRVPVGATLVRHSDPWGEVSETHGKAAGLLGAIGAVERTSSGSARPAEETHRLADDPRIARSLSSRNERLAPFWLNPQDSNGDGAFAGLSVLVVDAEDRFTTMLAHQLRRLGCVVTLAHWRDDVDLLAPDLVLAGPGPGDPRTTDDPRIARMRQVVSTRLHSRRPLLAVCLSHQILALLLEIELLPLDAPHQGVQKRVDLFGTPTSIGFYNTFTARVRPGTTRIAGRDVVAEVAADAVSGNVCALRGAGFASVQGHLESILSPDGLDALTRLVRHALTSRPHQS